jgi:hypothetical protein
MTLRTAALRVPSTEHSHHINTLLTARTCDLTELGLLSPESPVVRMLPPLWYALLKAGASPLCENMRLGVGAVGPLGRAARSAGQRSAASGQRSRRKPPTNGVAWGWHGVGMGLHGVGMGLAWGWHGAAWGWHGVCMGFAWGLHGVGMGLAWAWGWHAGKGLAWGLPIDSLLQSID